MKYTAAESVKNASNAESALGGLWAKAYKDASLDMARDGANLRDMAKAITATGVKCSKDTAGDYVLAHSLTMHGEVFESALSARIGADKVMRAHSLIAKARKVRGVSYVRAVLASLDELEGDKLAKAVSKAVKELDAAKRENTDKDSDTDSDGEEVEEVEEVETVDKVTTADDILKALTPLTIALRERIAEGDLPANPDAWLAEVATIARLMQKARKAA